MRHDTAPMYSSWSDLDSVRHSFRIGGLRQEFDLGRWYTIAKVNVSVKAIAVTMASNFFPDVFLRLLLMLIRLKSMQQGANNVHIMLLLETLWIVFLWHWSVEVRCLPRPEHYLHSWDTVVCYSELNSQTRSILLRLTSKQWRL